MMEIGTKVPDFEANSTQGPVRLYDFKDKKNVILIFYPINNTPLCRKQLCEARDALPDYEQLDAAVLGINPGKFTGHQKFNNKHQFGFPLVHDENWKIIAAMRVLTVSGLMVARTVYVVDKKMRLRYINKGMPTTAELKQVLEEINNTENVDV